MKKLLFISALFIPLLFVCSFSQYGKWNELHPLVSHNKDFKEYYRIATGMAKLTYGKVIIFGGEADHFVHNDTWIYDLNQNTWAKIITEHTPPARANHQLAQLADGKVLLFGGEDSRTGQSFDDTWVFDINKMDWENMNPSIHPTRRTDPGMCQLTEDEIILFGGDDDVKGNYSPETWIYNYEKNVWAEIPIDNLNWPLNRDGCGLAQISDGKVLMFGGWVYKRLNDTWLFERATNKWMQLQPINNPGAKSDFGLSKISDNYIILFGGSDSYGFKTDTTWMYNIQENNWYKADSNNRLGEMRFLSLAQIDNGKALLTGDFLQDATWLFELDSSFIDVKENVTNLTDIKTFINSNTELILDYYLAESGKPEIEIFNINGISVFKSENIQTQSGWNREIIHVDKLPAGVYFVRVRSGSLNLVEKFLVY